MKRIFSMMLVVAMIFLCGVNVFAASTGRITGAAVPNATMYELYLHYEGIFTLMATSSTIDFDLTSLGLEPGEHQFAVRATAPGFVPSSYSNLVTYTVSAGEAFAVYSATDNSLTFYKNNDTVTVGSTYKGKAATAVYKGFETDVYSNYEDVPWIKDGSNASVKQVVVENEIAPVSIAYWFYDFGNCYIYDLQKLNTLNVTDMSYAFYKASVDFIGEISLDLSSWNTSSVTNMYRMFYKFALDASSVKIDLSGWDVSKVTTMSGMFYQVAVYAPTFDLVGVSGWNTSSVTDMYRMFYQTAKNANYTLNLSGWNVNNVSNYSGFNTSVESKVIAPTFK